MSLCGGVGEARDADEEAQQILESVRPAIESKIGKTLSLLTAVKVATQMVAGVNFFIKAHVGNQEYIHVRIFQPLPHQGGDNELHGVQKGKGLGDVIEYFQE